MEAAASTIGLALSCLSDDDHINDLVRVRIDDADLVVDDDVGQEALRSWDYRAYRQQANLSLEQFEPHFVHENRLSGEP